MRIFLVVVLICTSKLSNCAEEKDEEEVPPKASVRITPSLWSSLLGTRPASIVIGGSSRPTRRPPKVEYYPIYVDVPIEPQQPQYPPYPPYPHYPIYPPPHAPPPPPPPHSPYPYHPGYPVPSPHSSSSYPAHSWESPTSYPEPPVGGHASGPPSQLVHWDNVLNYHEEPEYYGHDLQLGGGYGRQYYY